MRILLVEDDTQLRTQLRTALQGAGYTVDEADNGRDAQFLGDTEAVDAVVLDLGLPVVDGLTVLKRWRAEGRNMPVLILTARDNWHEKVAGIDAGADDYLTKPFAFAELVARVQALARRARPAIPPVIERAGIRLDTHRRMVLRGERPVELSRKEFAVLEELMRADGGVVSAEQLLEKAWDEQIDPFTNVVRFTMMNVRRKLGEPPVIETVPGVGYRLK